MLISIRSSIEGGTCGHGKIWVWVWVWVGVPLCMGRGGGGYPSRKRKSGFDEYSGIVSDILVLISAADCVGLLNV